MDSSGTFFGTSEEITLQYISYSTLQTLCVGRISAYPEKLMRSILDSLDSNCWIARWQTQ